MKSRAGAKSVEEGECENEFCIKGDIDEEQGMYNARTYMQTYIHTYLHTFIHTYVHTCLPQAR